MVRTAPSHKALWEPGWPGTPGRYSCPSQQPGTPEPTRDGREAWSTGPGGGLASWSSPLPGSDSRVLTLSTCTHTSLSLGTVLAQCSPAGPPRGPGDQLACSDLWCQPTAWPWTSPALGRGRRPRNLTLALLGQRTHTATQLVLPGTGNAHQRPPMPRVLLETKQLTVGKVARIRTKSTAGYTGRLRPAAEAPCLGHTAVQRPPSLGRVGHSQASPYKGAGDQGPGCRRSTALRGPSAHGDMLRAAPDLPQAARPRRGPGSPPQGPAASARCVSRPERRGHGGHHLGNRSRQLESAGGVDETCPLGPEDTAQCRVQTRAGPRVSAAPYAGGGTSGPGPRHKGGRKVHRTSRGSVRRAQGGGRPTEGLAGRTGTAQEERRPFPAPGGRG
nr:collagen alpha-2(V) chain-like [Delphinus delphis]